MVTDGLEAEMNPPLPAQTVKENITAKKNSKRKKKVIEEFDNSKFLEYIDK